MTLQEALQEILHGRVQRSLQYEQTRGRQDPQWIAVYVKRILCEHTNVKITLQGFIDCAYCGARYHMYDQGKPQ